MSLTRRFSTILPAIIACIAAGATLVEAAAPPPNPPSMTGTIRDAVSNPLGGMWIGAYDSNGNQAASATTDSTGAYKLTSLAAGAYRVVAADPNHVYATAFSGGTDSFDTSAFVTVTAGATATQDFQMQVGGRVTGDARNGNSGLPNVTIAAYNVATGTRRDFTMSAGDGSFTLVLAPGQYKIVAYDNDGVYGPIFYPTALSYADASIVTLNAGETEDAEFALAPAAHLTGTVADTTTAAPISLITVYAYTVAGNFVRSDVSDGSGKFSISLAAGSYRFIAADPLARYATTFAATASSFDSADVLTFSAGQTLSRNLVMVPGGQLRGQVRATTNGIAPAALEVAAYNTNGSLRAQATSNSSGAYSMVLPPGTYRVAAFDNALVYATQFYQQRTDFLRSTPVTITAGQITSSIDFSLGRAGRFTGTVTDASTAEPLPGITVAAFDATGVPIASVSTASTGAFTAAVPAGTYRLMAWDNARAYANTFDGGSLTFEGTAPRTIAADAVVQVPMPMSHGFVLGGKVVTPSQSPIAGIEVQALDTDGNHAGASITDSDGLFAVTLLPGRYKLLAHDSGATYPDAFFDRANTLAGATTIVVPSNAAPSPVVFVLTAPISRHRPASH